MNFDVKKIKLETGFYLAGFTDAEGCFCVCFSPKTDKNNEIYSWKVIPTFSICQKERHIIAQFKKHLKCGTVHTNSVRKISVFTVTNLHALRNHILPFFKKFGFQSAKKKTDFSNFCKVLSILDTDQLTKTDFQEILSLRVNTEVILANRIYSDDTILRSLDKNIHINEIKKSSETNTPNSENTKNIFNDLPLETIIGSQRKVIHDGKHNYACINDSLRGIITGLRPINEMIESDLYGDIKATNALNFYIAGFVDGDGSFNVSFRKRDDYTVGWKISPSFSIAQRDQMVLKLFQKRLDCGKIRKGSQEGVFYLEVLNLNDLRNKVIPFFKLYTFLSEVGLEKYQRFCKTVDILTHSRLSRRSLEQVLSLQRNQNKKSRYTSQQILDRFDEFTCKTKKF